MKVAKGCILDAGSLGPDADLGPILATLPEWKVWNSTQEGEVMGRIADVEVVLSNKIMIDAAHFRDAKKLRFIGVLATGSNNVDLAAARRHGVEVCNVKHYSTAAVVQHTLSLILNLAGNLQTYIKDVRDQKWQTSPFFCYFNGPIVELSGRVLTIVGAGSQGRALAQIAESMGMIVHFARRPGTGGASEEGSQRLPLAELLPLTDVLSFHCPLTDATRDLLNMDNIFKLRKGALVVNCARGGIVNEEALMAALSRGHLGGAAIDVLSSEPPSASHPLLKVSHPNFILTPHIAWATGASRQRLIQETAANLRAFFAGHTVNSVLTT